METPNLTGLVKKPILGESYVKWPNNHFLLLYFCYPGALNLRNYKKVSIFYVKIWLGQDKSFEFMAGKWKLLCILYFCAHHVTYWDHLDGGRS